MNRARMIGGLLALILLACVAVIFLDQNGAFGGDTAGNTPAQAAPANTGSPAPTPQPANNSSFGGLK